MTMRILLAPLIASALWAQTVPPPAPPPPNPVRQVDIGAAKAPLSDQERIDLDAAIRKHDYAAEKAVIDQAASEHPDSVDLLTMAGRLAYLEKHPADAAEFLARADKLKPLAEAERMTLALSYMLAVKTNECRAELLKLIRLDPKNGVYPYMLGRMYVMDKRYEEGAKALGDAIRVDPNFVRAYEDLGQVQEQLGQLDEAAATYGRGTIVNRLLPTHWEWSPLDLGVIKLKANDIGEAEKLFLEALSYKPRFAIAHYYMGQVRQKQGRGAEAMAEYKEAVVDDPKLRQAWLALGREFTRQGDQKQAERALEIFKKLEAQANAAKGLKN